MSSAFFYTFTFNVQLGWLFWLFAFVHTHAPRCVVLGWDGCTCTLPRSLPGSGGLQEAVWVLGPVPAGKPRVPELAGRARMSVGGACRCARKCALASLVERRDRCPLAYCGLHNHAGLAQWPLGPSHHPLRPSPAPPFMRVGIPAEPNPGPMATALFSSTETAQRGAYRYFPRQSEAAGLDSWGVEFRYETSQPDGTATMD